jgi:hypothetical protein
LSRAFRAASIASSTRRLEPFVVELARRRTALLLTTRALIEIC